MEEHLKRSLGVEFSHAPGFTEGTIGHVPMDEKALYPPTASNPKNKSPDLGKFSSISAGATPGMISSVA